MHLYNNVGKNNDDNILRDQIKHYMKKKNNKPLSFPSFEIQKNNPFEERKTYYDALSSSREI